MTLTATWQSSDHPQLRQSVALRYCRYSHIITKVRFVDLVPKKDWGGDGQIHQQRRQLDNPVFQIVFYYSRGSINAEKCNILKANLKALREMFMLF